MAKRDAERVINTRVQQDPGWFYYLARSTIMRRNRATGETQQVKATTLKRSPGFHYFVRGVDVWRVKTGRVGRPRKQAPETVMVSVPCDVPAFPPSPVPAPTVRVRKGRTGWIPGLF